MVTWAVFWEGFVGDPHETELHETSCSVGRGKTLSIASECMFTSHKWRDGDVKFVWVAGGGLVGLGYLSCWVWLQLGFDTFPAGPLATRWYGEPFQAHQTTK